MAPQQNPHARHRRGVAVYLDSEGTVTLYGREKWHQLPDKIPFTVVSWPRSGDDGDEPDVGDEERRT